MKMGASGSDQPQVQQEVVEVEVVLEVGVVEREVRLVGTIVNWQATISH
jgi:hypothetical protein